MNDATVKAALAVLCQRWPWPDEAGEIADAYAARLRLAVSDWRGERARSFKKAVSDVVGESLRFGRPTVDDLVKAALDPIGEGGRIPFREDPADRTARQVPFRLRAALMDQRLDATTATLPDLRAAVPAATDRHLRDAWDRTVVLRPCPCGSGVAVVAGERMRFVREQESGRGVYERTASYYGCCRCRVIRADEARYAACELQ